MAKFFGTPVFYSSKVEICQFLVCSSRLVSRRYCGEETSLISQTRLEVSKPAATTFSREVQSNSLLLWLQPSSLSIKKNSIFTQETNANNLLADNCELSFFGRGEPLSYNAWILR
jgi:hypothetical protein